MVSTSVSNLLKNMEFLYCSRLCDSNLWGLHNYSVLMLIILSYLHNPNVVLSLTEHRGWRHSHDNLRNTMHCSHGDSSVMTSSHEVLPQVHSQPAMVRPEHHHTMSGQDFDSRQEAKHMSVRKWNSFSNGDRRVSLFA